MKRLWITALVLCFLMVGCACMWDESEAGVFNEFQSLREMINNLGPKVGQYYDFMSHEIETIYCVSIFDFSRNNYHIGSLELGYYQEQGFLFIANFDLDFLNKLTWDVPLGTLRPYIGLGGGYDFYLDEWRVGPVISGFTLGF